MLDLETQRFFELVFIYSLYLHKYTIISVKSWHSKSGMLINWHSSPSPSNKAHSSITAVLLSQDKGDYLLVGKYDTIGLSPITYMYIYMCKYSIYVIYYTFFKYVFYHPILDQPWSFALIFFSQAREWMNEWMPPTELYT